MHRIIIFGNSGSGKSTLAKKYVTQHQLAHLDLDILAWQDSNPPERKLLDESAIKINQFLNENANWVIEGGYADLLSFVKDAASKAVFLNLGVDDCITNCKNRPWEPHKYESIEKQNENLDMLLAWVKDYYKRDDVFSLKAHQKLFENCLCEKVEKSSL